MASGLTLLTPSARATQLLPLPCAEDHRAEDDQEENDDDNDLGKAKHDWNRAGVKSGREVNPESAQKSLFGRRKHEHIVPRRGELLTVE